MNAVRVIFDSSKIREERSNKTNQRRSFKINTRCSKKINPACCPVASSRGSRSTRHSSPFPLVVKRDVRVRPSQNYYRHGKKRWMSRANIPRGQFSLCRYVTISRNWTQGVAKGRTGRRRAEMPHIYMLYPPRRGEGRSERLMNCASATNTGRVNDHRD
jgi:hypothetical protein